MQRKREKPKRRAITSIDLLVHPFYTAHWTQYTIDKRHVTRTQKEADREARQMASRWKDRIREVQKDPNAVLVIVRQTGTTADGKRLHESQLPPSTRKILNGFYSWCEGALGKPPKGRLFVQRKELDAAALKMELHERGFFVSRTPAQPRVHAYGELWLQCVRDEFRALLRGLQIPFNPRTTKIVHSLSFGEYIDRFAMQRVVKRHGSWAKARHELVHDARDFESLRRQDARQRYAGYDTEPGRVQTAKRRNLPR